MCRNSSTDAIEKNKLIEANIKLVDKVEELKRDISILIGYINGRKELENQVQEITEYYKGKNIK